jgi:prepilin peptidase CpaA
METDRPDAAVLTPPPAAAPAVTPPPAAPADDLGLDRAFLMSMARVPFIAVLWTAAAFLADRGWAALVPATEAMPHNLGSLVVICFGMVLAAFIDGYAFKVPNWCTLSLVVSGWYLGLLHDLGVAVDAGQGGIGQALLGTFVGFAALFPALFIGGMGQGDVKMTMGFGSWMGAFFGNGAVYGVSGLEVLWWSFALGVIVGGVFGLVMMALRRQFHKNLQNFQAIALDLQTLVTLGPGKAAERANARRKDWVRLPYGVPLCVGFLGYLWYRLILSA